jgi:hypothetical protein
MNKDSIVLILVALFLVYYFYNKTKENFEVQNEKVQNASLEGRACSKDSVNKSIYGYLTNSLNKSIRPI